MILDSETSRLERARNRDQSALAEIYDQYSNKIYSYIYHRVGDANLAEDITAQVFLHVIEAVQNEKAWTTSFSGWLYRIAHNLVVDHFRRRSRSNQIGLEDAPDIVAEKDDPQETAERVLGEEELRRAVVGLTEEQAQVVSLRFLEGHSILEVAEMMGKTEGAIKALQYRAVVSLRKILEEELA